MKKIIIALLITGILASCEARKELQQSRIDNARLSNENATLSLKAADLQRNITALNSKIADLNKQLGILDTQKGQLNEQSAMTTNQLNMTKQELEQQKKRAEQLEALLERQRTALITLKTRMTEALSGFSPKELTVEQKNGKVYISLSENLLFPTGSAVVNPKGVDALAKLAAVLNLNPGMSILIEGHTDSVPIHGRYQDNWDLSTARANAIVRILVNNYKVDPKNLEAAGHSKYDPVDDNTSLEGRARNRRTEIILSPNIDELYKIIGS
jgi:chemotaxis protein MotB